MGKYGILRYKLFNSTRRGGLLVSLMLLRFAVHTGHSPCCKPWLTHAIWHLHFSNQIEHNDSGILINQWDYIDSGNLTGVRTVVRRINSITTKKIIVKKKIIIKKGVLKRKLQKLMDFWEPPTASQARQCPNCKRGFKILAKTIGHLRIYFCIFILSLFTRWEITWSNEILNTI